MAFPIRSPRDLVGGIAVFGRILDKIRLNAKEGKLPDGYHLGYLAGSRTFDERVCKFLGVDFSELSERTLAGGTDEEILEWCCLNGNRPTAEQIEIWNGFMHKRGWRDAASAGLVQQRAEAGLGHREELVTFFDMMDVEEGRAP
jgi:gluconokinase